MAGTTNMGWEGSSDQGRYADLCRDAIRIGEVLEPRFVLSPEARIYVCGMGASAVAGEVVQSVARKRVISCRSDGTRFARDENGLVIVISYEGETPEARACLGLATRAARRRGSGACICVTGDPDLAVLAESHGAWVIKTRPGFDRSEKLAYLVLPLVAVLAKLGVVEAPGPWEVLYDAVTPSPEELENVRDVARKLVGRLPAVYGTDRAASAAVMMWGLLFREVADLRTWIGSVPDLLHDEVCTFCDRGTGPVTCGILLTANPQERRAAMFAARWRRELESSGALVAEVKARGESRLARFFSLAQTGERVAVQVAAARRADPDRSSAVLRSYKRKRSD